MLAPAQTTTIVKKIIGSLIIIVIIIIFGFNIYNSKSEYYKKHIEFYNKKFSSEVNKIVEGRGTKIYYNTNDYFYTFFCEKEYKMDEIIKFGDILVKKKDTLEVCRNSINNIIFSTKVIKPKKTYFEYFFN